ncbi:MAG TPA: PQQ-binding-like beta-propeller repeat protein [Saprospiraceae bacterium]|nr:PQQ-binding-like beta-propeller repeat protein [Saprospiraceae bacterium]
MKIIAYLPFLVIFILSFNINCGCTVDPPVDPGDTTKTDSLPYDIIWQTPQNITDSSGSYSPHFTPAIIGDLVFSANNVYADFLNDKDIDTITAYNIHTGEIIWKWSDFQSSQKYVSQNVIGDNIVFVTTGKEVVGIDALTGETLIRRISNKGEKRISVSQDILFHCDLDFDEKGTDIFYFDKVNSQWKKAIRIVETGNLRIQAYPPSAEIKSDGDTLLYFQKRFYRSEPFLAGSELYCYNLSKKQIVWNAIVDSLDSNINNTPYVAEGRIFFCSSKTVHCFDKSTGARIWRTHFPKTNFLATNYLMTEDKIVIGSDNGERIGVRKNDGKVVYNINSYASSFWRLNRYKNWLLNVHKQLEIYDINTGEQKFFLNTTHKKGNFNTGVAVDESTGLFYLPDGYNMMCIKVKGL